MITIHAAWDAAAQEWEATTEDIPGLRARAKTLKALREGIARLFGPDKDHPFQLAVLARHREPPRVIH